MHFSFDGSVLSSFISAAPRRMRVSVAGQLSMPTRFTRRNRFFDHLMQDVLRQHVRSGAPDHIDLCKCDIYYEEVRLNAPEDPRCGPYVMPLVTLRTTPCRWSRSAGCVMCGYHLGASREHVSDAHLIRQTEDAIMRLSPAVYPTIVFTSNGSFLDHAEVSDQLRPVLLRMLHDAGYQYLVVESRPEYITATRLRAMAAAFSPATVSGHGPHPISVSLGLESQDDFVQQYCINKGLRREDYLRAFRLLRREGLEFDCYVLLGKPFMSAREDVTDALRTVRFAIEQGAGYVFVMVTNLVDYSLTNYLIERGRYRLPSLWRAVELLDALTEGERKAVQIKGISHAPVPPRAYACTCERCTEEVKSAINFWNQTGEMEHLRAIRPCGCRDHFLHGEWSEAPQQPLLQRVLSEYRALATELGIDPRLIPEAEMAALAATEGQS